MQTAQPFVRVLIAVSAAAALTSAAGCDGLREKAFAIASRYGTVRNSCPPPGESPAQSAAVTAPANTVAASLLSPVQAAQAAKPAPRDAEGEAAAYLQQRGRAANPLAAVVLSYLSRRFDLDWARRFVAAADASGNLTQGPGRYYLPLLRADAPALALDRKMRLDFVGLYCSEMGFPEDYRDWLKSHDDENKLQEYVNLVAAYRWAVEQGCVKADDPEWLVLQERFGKRLAQLVDAQPKVSRAYLYAVDMLFYIDHSARVRIEWLDAIRAAQRPDGAWGDDTDTAAQRDYATALALWALHEASGRPRQTVAWSYPVSRPLSMR